MPSTLTALVAASLAIVLAAGCSKEYVRKYQTGVAQNRTRIETLRVGMSRSEVEALMGSGTTVDYKRIRLRNPHRTEVMKVSDSKTVEVFYYVTNGNVWKEDETSTLTPVIFENGKLVGWGWAFIASDKPKYVSGPP